MLTTAPVNFIFSMYIETKIIMQGLVYATRSDGPHQQVKQAAYVYVRSSTMKALLQDIPSILNTANCIDKSAIVIKFVVVINLKES